MRTSTSLRIYGQMDEHMDRQTDVGNDNTPPAWKVKG